jgi:hypothetical protein
LTRNQLLALSGWLVIPVLIFSLSSAPSGASPTALAAGDCSATATSLADPLTAGVWQEINDRRNALGLPAFTWSPTLAQSAAWMAQDIASSQPSAVPPSGVDNIGRDVRPRLTDCGYRSDAQVWETAMFMWATDPFSAVSIWYGNDTFRMFQALNSSAQRPPVYTAAALGWYYDAGSAKYFWVMDLGTITNSTSWAPTKKASR